MSLMNMPNCDLCGGIDFDDVLVAAYDEDTQEEFDVCPDCLETNSWLVVNDPGDEIDRVYDMMRDEEMGF